MAAENVGGDGGPHRVYGGEFVEPCGWPTTVSMEGSCTGTLVHPQVVIYAAHCGAGYGSVQFGDDFNGGVERSVPTEFCRTYPGGQPGNGTDFAMCVLSEPQNDIKIVPPLMGCETSILTDGQEVTLVGFGFTETGGYGDKKEVVADFGYITPNNEAFIGGGGIDTCQGDSGGPVFVKLPADENGDDTWRVFGITSYGGACGGGGFYSMMHIGMPWFEEESGFDLTPCFDAEGNWAPGPGCQGFSQDPGNAGGLWADGCDPGPEAGPSSICGAPFDADSDKDAPAIAIAQPENGTRFDSMPGAPGSSLTIEIDADDGEGYGVASVELMINGNALDGGVIEFPPYEFPVTMPPGQYQLDAIATDWSGNAAMAESVYIGVDMDAQLPSAEDSSSSGGGSDSGTTTTTGDGGDTGTDDGGTALATSTTADASDGDSSQGCGCSSQRGPIAPHPASLGLFALLGWTRRRPR